MSTADLTIDLAAIAENWRILDRMTAPEVETGATVKANAYGLGAGRVSRVLAEAGARSFFVAAAEEGQEVREAVGDDARVFVYSGHMPGDSDIIASLNLIPLLNSIEQITRHVEMMPDHPFGIQINSGMNRLGLSPEEWEACKPLVLPFSPRLIMSHLACGDTPDEARNHVQRQIFRDCTAESGLPRSIAASAGILLGAKFHLDLVRPGIGLYGGWPMENVHPVVHLHAPVIQSHMIQAGDPVGYANSWTAERPTRIATAAVGYADGLIRAGSDRAVVYSGETPCPVVGRVSMDMITIDITDLDYIPESVEILGANQTIDDLAVALGTIGYEVLTSLGHRYRRHYVGEA